MRTSSLATLAAVTTLVVLAGTATVHAQTRASATAGQKAMMAPAATNMAGCYIKIEGVEGEGPDSAVSINSFSWGVSNPTSMGSSGLSAGKATFKEFTVTKRIDKSSPMLLTRMAMGQHIKSAKLFCRNAGGGDYYQLTLQDVLISSFVSQSGDGMPMESLSFNYTKIEYSYSPTKSDGSLDKPIVSTYDLKANKK